jgi:Na+/H+ antiporter NhaD/arsenite permease-like protein
MRRREYCRGLSVDEIFHGSPQQVRLDFRPILLGAAHDSEVNHLLATQTIKVVAVCFGANTYVGSSPNFMVKAVAEQDKVRTPTSLGFVFKYTWPSMLPMLVVVWWIFFRK